MFRYGKDVVFDPDGFPLAVRRTIHLRDEPRHSHQFSEIVVVIGGTGTHVAGRRRFPIRAGDVYVLTGRQTHEYQSPENLRIINIMYDPGALKMPLRDLKRVPGYHVLYTLEPALRTPARFDSHLNLPPEELARVNGMVLELERELDTRAPGYRFMAAAQFMRIVGHLARCYHREKTAVPEALLRMGETLSYMEAHLDDGAMTLDNLASRACMSTRNFMRTFKRALGVSPIRYLIALRVARAAELLRDTNRSITTIAFDVGFQDGNYFSRAFKTVMGVSPRDYRHAAIPPS